MKKTCLALGLSLWFTTGAIAEGDTLVLKADVLYPGDGTEVRPGAVLIQDGSIAGVGSGVSVPEGVRVVEVPGGAITPGLIDAAASPGFGLRSPWVEQSSEVVARTRVADGLAHSSHAYTDLLQHGVTTIHVASDSSSVIGARGALLKTGCARGGPSVVDPVHGVKGTMAIETFFGATINSSPFGAPIGTSRRPTTRMGLVWAFRKAFYDAVALRDSIAPPSGNPVAGTEEDLRVLIDVLAGEVPFRILARTRGDIDRAMRLSDEFGFDFILEEGLEAHLCLDLLREKEIPVIYGPVMIDVQGSRLSFGSPFRLCLESPRRMAEKGVVFALSGFELLGENSLPHQACFAMRYGLSFQDALRAVTSTPARLLGIGDRVGRIENGLEADLVVWSGRPFDPTTQAVAVLIGGEILHSQIPDAN